MNLVVGDTVQIVRNGRDLPFNGGTETIFTCRYEGAHIFWVNASLEVWVTEPAAPAVVWEFLIDGTPVKLAPEADPGQDKAVYKTNLEVGQKVAIKEDGKVLHFYATEDGSSVDKGEEFVCKISGEHVFYVNQKDEVWVTEPTAPAGVMEFLIDGTPVNLAPEADPGQDKVVYKATLQVGQKVAIKEDGKVLHFYATEDGSPTDKGEEFVCKIAGEHVFYINKNNEIWVVEPAAPVKEISVLVNGQVVNLAPEADPGQDKAVYKTTLAVGDKISFKEGDDFIHFYVWDGEANKAVDLGAEFTAKIAGVHIFWINKNNEIYVGEPAAPVKEISVLVNGQVVNLVPEADPGDNRAVYKTTLAVGDKVSFKEGDDFIHFYVWDGEANKAVDLGAEFTAKIAGEHTFWISKNNEIYVGEPTIPEAALVFYVDGEPVNLAPEENPGDNKAVYKITLEVGQKVMIWAGEDRLHFYVSEEGSPVDKGVEFQASVAGEHVFYVNKDNQIWFDAPTEPVQNVYSLEVNGTAIDLAPEENPGENNAVYKVPLEAEDKLIVKLNGTVLLFGDEGKTFYEAGVDGVHTVYINKNNIVYVEAPQATHTYVFAINGMVANIAPAQMNEEEVGTNFAIYKDVPLKAKDVVKIVEGQTKLLFYATVEGQETLIGEDFVVGKDGNYTFWINKENKVYVGFSEAPVTHDISIYAGEAELEITPATLSEGEQVDNIAAYKDVPLTKGQVISIKDNADNLHFYTWNQEEGNVDLGTTYTIPWDGNYTFWINKDGKVWIDAPAEPVKDIVIKVNDEPVTVTPEENPGDNRAVYKVTLAVGDTISFSEGEDSIHFYRWDAAGGGAVDLGATFTAAKAGVHTFWINKSNQIYVGEPEDPVMPITILVNGELVTVEPEENPGDNKSVYKVSLDIDDTIVFKEGNDSIHFYIWDEETHEPVDQSATFTATKAGVHTFWINKSNQIYVGEPEDPVKPITVLVNGELVTVTPEEDPGNDKAVYKVTLALNDKISFKEGDDLIHFYAWDAEAEQAVDLGSEYTAKKAGEHTFWINKQNQIYVGEPVVKGYSIEVNGTPIDLAPEENPGDNKAVYKTTLKVGDKVVIKLDGTALGDEGGNKEFTCEIAGEHIIYVNNENILYIVEPALPEQSDWFITFGTDNFDSKAHFSLNPGNAKEYMVTVEATQGQQFAIYSDDEHTHLLGYDNIVDTQPLDSFSNFRYDRAAQIWHFEKTGTYTFYVKHTFSGKCLYIDYKAAEA